MTSAGSVRDREPALEPCPASPNCVSSLADDEHYIAPFTFSDTPERARKRLQAAVRAQPRTLITADTGNMLHAEARSLVFRFVDDLAFMLLPEEGLIHVRSASRTGYSDFGVNRRRVERIRRRFEQTAKRH
ncbi:MAG: DUF1499 domain-containing protein [Gammaproteobacteria bacterium]